MPQMNPMNWTLLLVLFNCIFLTLMAKLHFFKLSSSNLKSESSEGSYEAPSFTKEI